MPRDSANWDPAEDTRVQQTRCEADAELARGAQVKRVSQESSLVPSWFAKDEWTLNPKP